MPEPGAGARPHDGAPRDPGDSMAHLWAAVALAALLEWAEDVAAEDGSTIRGWFDAPEDRD